MSLVLARERTKTTTTAVPGPRRSTRSAWRSPAASSSPSSGPAAAARRRCSTCSAAWTVRRRASCTSTGSPCTTSPRPSGRACFGAAWDSSSSFFNLIPNLTVADNVELAGLLGGLSGREAARRATALLTELGLQEARRAFPGRLSGGEQQRVALARAVINRPDLLLADEPTGNLDSRTARDVMRLVRRFHDEGQTIVMVTHDQAIASQADRVIRLRDGRLAAETRLEDQPPVGVEM
ncbi:MAG TPA: ATP-binding cassette domain-containing protein [Solirubrobacteraceae bacterium]